MTKALLTLRVHGERHTVAAEPHHTLLEVLRAEPRDLFVPEVGLARGPALPVDEEVVALALGAPFDPGKALPAPRRLLERDVADGHADLVEVLELAVRSDVDAQDVDARAALA